MSEIRARLVYSSNSREHYESLERQNDALKAALAELRPESLINYINYIDFMEERGFARKTDCDILREAIKGGLWDAYVLYQCSRQVGCDHCSHRSGCRLAAEFDGIEALCAERS